MQTIFSRSSTAKQRLHLGSKNKIRQNHQWKPLFMTLRIGLPTDKKKWTASLNNEPGWDRKISNWNKTMIIPTLINHNLHNNQRERKAQKWSCYMRFFLQLTNHREEIQLEKLTTYSEEELNVEIHILIRINKPMWEDISLKAVVIKMLKKIISKNR